MKTHLSRSGRVTIAVIGVVLMGTAFTTIHLRERFRVRLLLNSNVNTAMITVPLKAQNNEAGDAAKPEPFESGFTLEG
jgi:hypothetical protein